MARKVDITFDSKNGSNKESYQLASGYVSQTAILFKKENVVAVIQAKGSVEFYSMDNELIAVGTLPPVGGGKEVYKEIYCQAVENSITLQFPIYEWIDNYPNCDGEYDRWGTKTIGFHTLTFDLLTGALI